MAIIQKILGSFLLIICFLVNYLSPMVAAATDELQAQRNWVELAGRYHLLSNSYGDWKGGEAKACIGAGRSDVLLFYFLAQKTFGDDGVYGSVNDTHIWNDDWYSQLAVGAGSGKFYFPDARVDASLSKKWLHSRSLVTTLGGGFSEAKDIHRDMYMLASVTVYLGDNFIAEAGTRITWSNPGTVQSERGFGVIIYGTDRNRYVTLRYEGGKEGYQPIGTLTTIVDFSSHEASLDWREWVGRNYGTVAKAEYYRNPFYLRNGLTFGLFYEW
jgi:YaiO family outer membrane protein